MALFDGLARRVAQRAQGVADETRRRVEAMFTQFPDVQLRREGDAIVIEAIGLMRRWMSDARLRFALWSSR
ncbi:MAG TPA: hypothetical protein VNJ05_07095 [Sphingomicrobium sp.]|nr:hypothetical protein [Sphingomicrobium sp.]